MNRILTSLRFVCLTVLLLLAFCNCSLRAQTVHPDYVDGEIYIKFRAEFRQHLSKWQGFAVAAPNPFQELAILGQEYGFSNFRKASKLPSPVLSLYYKVKFEEPAKVQELIEELQKLSYVEFAESVEYLKTFHTPNDLNENQWGLQITRAQEAWDISRGSAEIVVAVIDDAVYLDHLDLAPNAWVNPNEIPGNNRDDDGNGYRDDVNGYDVANNDPNPNPPANADAQNFSHGTHCAGIVSAASNNGRGIASIGYGIKLMGVKCKPDNEGGPSIPFGYEGIDYAIAAGADVLSLSWGGPGSSNFAQALINEADRAGIVIVAAAGNDNTSQRFFPAAYDNVICVGATDWNDRKANFSNFGSYVDVMAPGVQILSTVPGNPARNNYSLQSGTSMACPFVAGLVGLMKSNNPNLRPRELTTCLINSCVNIDGLNGNFVGRLGAGRVDAFGAVRCIEPEPVDYDLAIQEILQPGRFTCDASVVPVVDIYNNGTRRVNNFILEYQYDDAPWDTVLWSGNMAPDGVEQLILPEWQLEAGDRMLRLRLSKPNGQEDQFTPNDTTEMEFTRVDQLIPMPFSENFESFSNADPETQNPNGWMVDNPDNDVTWSVYQIVGNGPGQISAGILLYRYSSPGQRDGLVTPPIDLNNYQDLELTFKHAYRRFSADIRDSLIVYVSDDCGKNFTRVFAGGGGEGFATGFILNGREFAPQNQNDWCGGANGQLQPCSAVDMNQFSGKQVMLKFESFNANTIGNNIFLDDINLTGRFAALPPKALVVASRRTICVGDTVRFMDRSSNTNQTIPQWTLSDGELVDSTSRELVVRYMTPGLYGLKLKYTTENGEDEFRSSSLVEVVTGPDVNLSQNSLKICLRESDTLEVSANFIYNWSPQSGISRIDETRFVFSPTTTTTYTVQISNTTGCPTNRNMEVLVSDFALSWDISQNEETPGRFDLNNTSVGSISQTWLVDGSISYTEASAIHNFIENGSYSLRLIADDGICKRVRDTMLQVTQITSRQNGMSADDHLQVYPVPVQSGSELTVRFGSSTLNSALNVENQKVLWIDATGRTVYSAFLRSQTATTGVLTVPADLPAGVYALRMAFNGTSIRVVVSQ